MNVLFDHQIFRMQKYGGISRYFYNLIKDLKEEDDLSISCTLKYSKNHYIANNDVIRNSKFFNKIPYKLKGIFINDVHQFHFNRAVIKNKFDIFHPTYYDTYFLDKIGNKPFVLTVYDMIHEKFSFDFPKFDKTSQHKKLLVERASKIIAISENTKKDLVEIFGIDESKIEVIYLATSKLCNYDFKNTLNIPERYILFVGSRGGYKNFNTFIKGMAKLLQNDREIFIVCAGGSAFTDKEHSLFRELGIARQVIALSVSDSQLGYLYENACLFIFPSLYEGFGIPILESFSYRCPIICSRSSSLAEVADDGAMYFDPYSEGDIYSTAKKVLECDSIRNKLVDNGLSRLKHFSWKKTALATKKVYEGI